MLKLRNKYYILRHGQTVWQTRNKDFIYPKNDSQKVHLTPLGKKQIKKAAFMLKKKNIDLIFSSDFFRTRQTAAIVSKALRLPVTFDKALRDIDLGIYMGKKKEEFYKEFPKHSKEKRFFKAPPEGESWLQCQERMLNFIKRVDKMNYNKAILIISHGDPLWLLEGAVRGLSLAEMLKRKKNSYIKVGQLRRLI